MARVYRIKPLEKKSITWEVEMYRKNADDTISWFNVYDTYRWGQGFIDEDLSCNLPYEGDPVAYARVDSGFGADFDDQCSVWFEFSDDLTEDEQANIEKCYLDGDGDEEWERSGAAWLFDAEHEWQLEDDYVTIRAPYQVDLCDEDGTVVEENIKLAARPDPNTSWPFSPEFPNPDVDSEGGEE
jgi:hypothetical protein